MAGSEVLYYLIFTINTACLPSDIETGRCKPVDISRYENNPVTFQECKKQSFGESRLKLQEENPDSNVSAWCVTLNQVKEFRKQSRRYN